MVSVIIVTLNVQERLIPCLNSVIGQTYAPGEVVVINNAQDTIPADKFSGYKVPVRLFNAPRNLFYCEALNEGIRITNGEFVLCLNDDVTLDPGFIEEGLKGFYKHPKICMVSGKLMRSDKKTIDSTGLFISIWRTAQERGYGAKDKGQFEKEEYIFGVNGAAAFYRRKMLEDVRENEDYFDPGYRIFYEDLDISWRAQRQGWKGYYLPRAVAYHIRGATVRKKEGFGKPFARAFLNDELHLDLIKNRYFTIIRNETFVGFILHLPFILIYEFLSWGYILIFNPSLLNKFLTKVSYLKSALSKRTSGYKK